MDKKPNSKFLWSVSVQYTHWNICLYLLAGFACHLEYPVKKREGISPCRKEKLEIGNPKSWRENHLLSEGAVTCTQHDLGLPGIHWWGKSLPLWGRLLHRASHLFLRLWTGVMNVICLNTWLLINFSIPNVAVTSGVCDSCTYWLVNGANLANTRYVCQTAATLNRQG